MAKTKISLGAVAWRHIPCSKNESEKGSALVEQHDLRLLMYVGHGIHIQTLDAAESKEQMQVQQAVYLRFCGGALLSLFRCFDSVDSLRW